MRAALLAGPAQLGREAAGGVRVVGVLGRGEREAAQERKLFFSFFFCKTEILNSFVKQFSNYISKGIILEFVFFLIFEI